MKPPHLTDKQWRMELLDKLEIEAKIKDGAENMLQVLDKKEKSKTDTTREGMRSRVESELNASVARIALLNEQLREVPVGHDVPIRGIHQQNHIHTNNHMNGGGDGMDTDDTNNESPSWLISNIVQALDDPAVNADDLVTKCNELVRVFTRYPCKSTIWSCRMWATGYSGCCYTNAQRWWRQGTEWHVMLSRTFTR